MVICKLQQSCVHRWMTSDEIYIELKSGIYARTVLNIL